MEQLKLHTNLLAPSKYLGNILAKEIRVYLEETNPNYNWRCSIAFTNEVRVKETILFVSDFKDSISRFVIGIIQSVNTKEDTGIKIMNNWPHQRIIRECRLGGWVEIDLKRGDISVFYEVLGNVTRDYKQAISMAML